MIKPGIFILYYTIHQIRSSTRYVSYKDVKQFRAPLS